MLYLCGMSRFNEGLGLLITTTSHADQDQEKHRYYKFVFETLQMYPLSFLCVPFLLVIPQNVFWYNSEFWYQL